MYSKEFESAFQKILDEMRGKSTAVSIAVIKDGELLAAAASGTKDGDPAHPAEVSDLYNVGSVSKTYCAMAVMKLVELGLADLDTPIYQYLPRLYVNDERYTKITLRHCLNHSCALPGTAIGNRYASEYTQPEDFYDMFYDYLSKATMKAEPGEYMVYCNDGFSLAEMVVAKRSGMGYTEFLRKYFLDPLGCYSTCTGVDRRTDRAHVCVAGEPVECAMALGSGGINTDMTDCAKWGWAHIEPGVAFTQEQVDTVTTLQTAPRTPENIRYSFGLGWDVIGFQLPGIDLGPHAFMKSGGTDQFTSYLVVSPALRLSASISMTREGSEAAMPILARCIAAVTGDQARPPEVPKPCEGVKLPEGYAEKYAGRYYSATCFYEVSFKDDKLTIDRSGSKKPLFEDLPFNGKDFGGPIFITDERGIRYLELRAGLPGVSVIAEIPASFGTLDPTWLARDGKRYFITSAKHSDLILGNSVATGKIEVEKDTGIVWFVMNTRDGGCNRMPAMSDGPDKLRTFLTAPNGGSRDHFAPVLTKKDGVEHIRVMNIDATDESVVKELTEGSHDVAENGMQWFSVPAGKKYKVEAGKARLTVVDGEGFVLKDSMCDGEVTEVEGPGWLWAMTGEETCVKAAEIRA